MSTAHPNNAVPGPGPEEPRLLTRNFLMLFLLLLFCNCIMAVYYCFEQWLDKAAVSPNWRGLLLGALYGMVMLTRPWASVLLLNRNKLPWTLAAILVSALIMPCYSLPRPDSAAFVWLILLLRLVQGVTLGIFSACTVAVMVGLFPPGQSARGFALFSLTVLLPYAMMPALGETLLPLLRNLGGEAGLFAFTGLLGLPSLFLACRLAPVLRAPELTGAAARNGIRALLRTAARSGLSLLFLASLCFGLATGTAIFFVKGLCTVTGGNPALFFVIYTLTMIVIRTAGSGFLDRLPRRRLILPCSFFMSLSFLGMAWLPLRAYGPSAFLYGLNLSLLYPLLAALICDRSLPETRSLNSNFMMLTFDAAALIAPLIGGGVISLGLGYRGVFTVGGALVLACGLCVWADRQAHR